MTEQQVFDLANKMGLRPCRDRTDGGVTIQPPQPDGSYYNLRFSPEDNIGDAGMAINFLLAEVDRLTTLAATHLADQELLVAQERQRVARECAEIADNHQSQEFYDGCGTGRFIARTIRAKYGVEE